MSKPFNLERSVRKNIVSLTPYSSARKEFSGTANIFLDANENSFGSPIGNDYHRYPDPLQIEIKTEISRLQGINIENIFIGNGSDEAIDLLFRIFCEPKTDNILICPPTYGMYEISAQINDVAVKRVNLSKDFELNFDEIKRKVDEKTKIVFFCSPNNPTGNSLNRAGILEFAENFSGIVVIDEAYIHFSKEKSFLAELAEFENSVVLQTFSKAWGLAGLRIGLAFANEVIITLFNKVKPPYNVSEIAQKAILKALKKKEKIAQTISEIIRERDFLSKKLKKFSFVETIFPSDANFILVKTGDANSVYKFLLHEKIVVRNRTNVELCEGCLRITVGTGKENKKLLETLKKYEAKQ